jgi:hypothetical protein
MVMESQVAPARSGSDIVVADIVYEVIDDDGCPEPRTVSTFSGR